MELDAATLRSVQEHFGLPSPALVEKDFYVLKALAAIAAVDPEPFRLVFGGGTALSRAYRLIRRMSEDIDLRIVAADNRPGGVRYGACARRSLGRSLMLAVCRQLRSVLRRRTYRAAQLE